MASIKNPLLHRYWVEFEPPYRSDRRGIELICWPPSACGVTAYTVDDALWLMREQLLRGEPLPPIRKVVEDVDPSTLDAGHVLPNIFAPIWRGVWYPRGCQANNSRSLTQLHRFD